MRATEAKIKALEGKLKSLQDRNQLVMVTFSDGTRRSMPLPDTILLLLDYGCGKDVPEVVSIDGDPSHRSGALLDLVREITGLPPEEVAAEAAEILAE